MMRYFNKLPHSKHAHVKGLQIESWYSSTWLNQT